MTFAKFKTAYLQRIRLVDATLVADVYVNQLVTYNPSTGAIAASNDKTASNSAIIALADVNLGVLASKMAVPYTHTLIENKSWAYDHKVAASTAKKKVAIYLVKDVEDVETYQTDVVEQLN